MKIIIFGASGSGTTTLGKALEEELSYKHLDADDYYWEQTDPPFQKKLTLALRNSHLWKDYKENKSVIISGSLVTWGSHWEQAFDLAVFLHIPAEIRLQRLATREQERYGEQLSTDKKLHQDSQAFLEWAAKYDDPRFQGRSITQHRQWIKRLSCPTLEIAGDTSVERRIELIQEKIALL